MTPEETFLAEAEAHIAENRKLLAEGREMEMETLQAAWDKLNVKAARLAPALRTQYPERFQALLESLESFTRELEASKTATSEALQGLTQFRKAGAAYLNAAATDKP